MAEEPGDSVGWLQGAVPVVGPSPTALAQPTGQTGYSPRWRRFRAGVRGLIGSESLGCAFRQNGWLKNLPWMEDLFFCLTWGLGGSILHPGED